MEISNTLTSVLVTGGAGFIGSNIVDELILKGVKHIKVIDNLSNGYIENIDHHIASKKVTFYNADITNYDSCLEASRGTEVIFHQAALGSIPRSIAHPEKTHLVNTVGFINILNAARTNGVRRVVFASSSSVFGDNTDEVKIESRIGKPLSPYAVSKLCKEQYARVFAQVYNMDIIGLRYFNVFGPKQSPKGPYAAVIPIFIEALMNNKTVNIHGDGEQTRDFTFIKNVVYANILAATSKNKFAGDILNIACGKTVSVNQVYHTIKTLLNSEQTPNYIPSRLGDIKNSKACIDLAKKSIKYTPQLLFETGISETLDWYKANIK